MNFGSEDEDASKKSKIVAEASAEVRESQVPPMDNKKLDDLKRAGQSLKVSLLENHKFRASTIAPDQRFRAANPDAKAKPEVIKKSDNLRDTMMPDFNIKSCDHLGLLSTSFTRLLTQKNINKIKETLKSNKEPSEFDHFNYLFSDYIDKFDSKLNKAKCILLITTSNIYLFSPKDMSLISTTSLKNLEHILIIRSNDSLVGLKMKNAKDLFLESVRRIEFVVYLINNAEIQKTPVPKIVNSSKVNLN